MSDGTGAGAVEEGLTDDSTQTVPEGRRSSPSRAQRPSQPYPCGHYTRHSQSIGCCSACKELFGSDSAFMAHRKGGRCMEPGALTNSKGAPLLRQRESTSAPGEMLWVLAKENTFRRSEPESTV